ncbi:MAG TPA: LCP family protein [Candidatus Paceibacterota bacterium]|nr:LCP family protein [Candidatus Paceibacterota bacterium]HPP64715.1 LCP family protein [Candidatus Paceibacterota bacterium]
MQHFLKQSLKKIFIVILGIAIGFYLWGLKEPRQYLISFSNNNQPVLVKKEQTALKPKTNILFLGIAGDGSRGALLTDTIFVVQLNSLTKKVAVVSIPRDLWVKNNLTNTNSKINELYVSENSYVNQFSKAKKYSLIKNKVSEIIGEEIDYVVIFDLVGFGKLVDAIGGVTIWLEKDIVDPNLVNPYNPSEIFKLEAGWRNLDGKLAIKFVRSRYDKEGDFYRMKNQQQLLANLKDKITKISSSWNLIDWLKIWQSLEGHFITDLDLETALNFFKTFKNTKSEEIIYLSLTTREPDKLLASTSYLWTDPQTNEQKNIYVLIPKAGFENYSEIQNYLKSKING